MAETDGMLRWGFCELRLIIAKEQVTVVGGNHWRNGKSAVVSRYSFRPNKAKKFMRRKMIWRATMLFVEVRFSQ